MDGVAATREFRQRLGLSPQGRSVGLLLRGYLFWRSKLHELRKLAKRGELGIVLRFDAQVAGFRIRSRAFVAELDCGAESGESFLGFISIIVSLDTGEVVPVIRLIGFHLRELIDCAFEFRIVLQFVEALGDENNGLKVHLREVENLIEDFDGVISVFGAEEVRRGVKSGLQVGGAGAFAHLLLNFLNIIHQSGDLSIVGIDLLTG